MARKRTIGNRIAPARFILFLLALVAGCAVGVFWLGWERGLLAGFDLAAAIFIFCCAPLLKLGAADLRNAAKANDANRWVLLAISFFLTLVILAAITAQLGAALGLSEKMLIVLTLVLIWTFGNTVYALHYAHLYYSTDDGGRDAAGLEFPGKGEPDMPDFVYFAFTLGVAVQTADVAITSRHIRRVATVHCIAGFFFNLGVLSLAVNVLGSS
jgi:uncharacterized membrane protein